jgi:hypothetical protein
VALTTLAMVPSPVGRVSANVALVAVLGPALVITRLKVSVPPALGVAVLAVLLMPRSATSPTVMVAVPVLLPGVVSVVPGGVLTVATLAIVPLAVPATLTWKVTVMVPAGGSVTVPLRVLVPMLKLPVVAPPPVALTTLAMVPSPVGRVSANVALVAVLGPALVITRLKVSVPPALGVAVLAVLLMPRSATSPTVMVAVPVLLPGVVSVVPGGVLTVATLAIVPLAVPATLTWKVTVMVPAGGSVTVPLRVLVPMLKLPVVAPPPVALTTLAMVPSPVGRVSANVALVAVLGPALVITRLKVSVPPALGVAVLAVLLMPRSATSPTVMVAVPVLLPGVVSVVPGGVLTVATLAIVPLAVPATLTWKVTVMVPAGGSVTVPLRVLVPMLKLPVVAPPPVALTTLAMVPSPVGRVSANVALVAVLGPALVITRLKVSVPPALGVAVLAVLLMPRSATSPTVMVAVPVLLPGVVSVVPGGVLTVATLAIVPLAVPATLTWKVTVMVPAGGSVTVPLRVLVPMLKLPVVAPPPVALTTLAMVPSPVGRVSANVALVAVLGPALVITRLKVSVPPALGVAVLAVLLMPRSATSPTVMVAVPVLLPGVVSVVPGGVLTVATLAIVPLAVPATLTWKVTVMVPAGGSVTVPLRVLVPMLKLPVVAPPPVALTTLAMVPSPVGRVSANVALVAVLGPALVITRLKVSVPPALGVAVLAVLLMPRSATSPTVMVAVPVLLPGVVSVVPGGVLTVATLAIVPLAVPATLTWKVTVMVPAGGSVTVPLRVLVPMLKLPVVAPPPVALTTLAMVPSPVGRVSANVALVAVLGPALVITRLKVSVPPALGVAVLAVLLMPRSATSPTVMVAVPVLLPGVVSVVPGGVLTVATLAIVPLAVPATLTWKVTVMVPAGGSVTVPLRVLVPMLKLPVVAPPPVALTTLAMVPSPVGRVSANVALVAVLGPALVITRLKVSVPPALGVAVLAVLLMPRSATSPTVMVAVPVLLPGVVSVVPGGVLTVATLAIVPLAVPATLTWKVTVMVPAGGSVTVPLRVLVPMLKLPVVAPPPVALTTLAMVPSPVGRVSANVALVAVLGPALVITRLKVSVPPALGVAVLAVLLMPRSATSPTVMVAVPVLLPGVVSVVPGGVLTVATLAIVPLAVPATLTWKVTVMVPAGGSVTVPLRVLVPMLKLPVVAPPPVALTTLAMVPSPVGRVSANVALVAVLGPALVITRLKVSVPPALGVAVLAVLLMPRSATSPTVMVAVPVLLPGVVSVVPGGVLTVATLAIVPLAVPATLTCTVMPGGSVTVPLRVLVPMLKLPVVAPPPVALTTLAMVPSPVGRVSANVALVAVLGPALVITRLKVSVPPALGVAVLAVLLMPRSATSPTVMVAVPVLLPGVVSVVPGGVLTVATLAIVPLAVPATLTWKVTVMVPAGGSVTVPLRVLVPMLKLPVVAPPPVALTTLAMVPSPVGRVSANVALVAVLGPALVITRLKVSVPPALGVAVLAVLLMPRSATSPTVMVAVPVLLPGVVSVVPGGVLTVATLAIVPLAVPATLTWKVTVMVPAGGSVTVPLRVLVPMLKLPVVAPPPVALTTLAMVPSPVGRVSANVALVAVLGPALVITRLKVSVPPALGVAVLAVLLMPRSATSPTVMVAVPVLLPGVVSVVPGGVLTVATLAIVPLAVPATLTWKVTVMVPAGGSVTVPLRVLVPMLKLPVVAPPPVALTTLAMVPSPVGRVSANVALVAVLGPALVITRLKVSVPPALGVAVLAVLLMPRSATSPTVMVAVPVLLPGVVSVVPGGVLTVATLAIVPLAVPATLTWKVTVMVPAGGSVTVPLRVLVPMLKLPVVAPPPVALTTLAMVPSPVGRVSANVALVAVLGPALVITRLKVSVPPALGVAVLAVLLMPRSATSPTVMVAVPVLLPGVVSVVPGGVLTVATLAIVPLAVPATLTWKVTVMVPAGGSVTVPLRVLVPMLKLPVVAPPPVALTTLAMVPSPVGRVSANVALVAVLGPALVITRLKVSVPPALGVAVLAVLLMPRSATSPTVMVAVPVLLPGVVSVVPGGVLTVATLAIVPLAVPATLTWKVTVMVPAGGSVTVPLRVLVPMLKLPVVAPPPVALTTLAMVPSPVGRVSANVALVAVLGPALVITRLKVSVPPALGVAVLAVLLMPRSATSPTVMVAVPVLLPGVVSVVPGGVLTVATLAIVPLAVPATLTWKVTVMVPAGGSVTVPLRVLVPMLKLPVVAPPPVALTTLAMVPSPVGRVSANVALVAVLGPALVITRLKVSVPPALGVAVLAVLLMPRSATSPTVMVAVPVLLPGVVSVVPGGVLTVATLAIVPLAVPATLTWKVTVMVPAGGSVTVPLRVLVPMLKLPVVAPPPVALTTLAMVPSPVGRVSANVALVAVLGPALVITRLKVSVPPALGVAVLAVLLMPRSATSPTVMVAVPVLLPGVVSVVPGGVLTVATLAIVPLAVPATLTWKVTVMVPAGGSVTVPLRVLVPMLKLPVVAPPPVALTTLAMVPSPVGRVSANVALVAVLGPALVITRLKVSVPPALGVAVLAVLLMPRSATSPTVMVAVPVLLPGVVSVVPGGVLTVATLAIVPLAVPATLTWKVTVMVPAGGSVTVPLRVLVPMLKLPVVAPPPVALTTLAMVPSPVGRVSANVALVAVLGPALVITRLKVSVPPALGVAVLAVLLMPRSATSPTVMVAVPVLLPGVVSVVPGGVLTVATLAIVPLAVPATLTWKVTVMVPAGGSVTVPLRVLVPMLKLPVVAPPPVALTTLAMVPSPVGRVSANVALVAVLGPALVITRLKVSVPPALGVAVLAVLLMPRSATSPTVMVAVPVLLPGVVSVVPGGVLTVATLAIVPLAVPATLTWKVTVMVPAGGSVTVPLRVLVPMLKLPVVAPPPVALTTLAMVPSPVGRVSANVALVAVLGPALVITRLKVSVPPALGVAVLAVLLMPRSATRFTASVSAEVQTPSTEQLGSGFALPTFPGGVIDAVFVTDDCANATGVVRNDASTTNSKRSTCRRQLRNMLTRPIKLLSLITSNYAQF